LNKLQEGILFSPNKSVLLGCRELKFADGTFKKKKWWKRRRIYLFSLPFCSYINILKDLSFSWILLYQIITSHYHLSDVSYISFCTINQQKNQLSHTHMGFANNILLKLRKTLFCLLKSVQRFQEQMESRETSWTARDGPLLTSKWNKSNWIYQLFHYMFVL
jgi:hypothetical protein